jgi:hypothetical protein
MNVRVTRALPLLIVTTPREISHALASPATPAAVLALPDAQILTNARRTLLALPMQIVQTHLARTNAHASQALLAMALESTVALM